MGRGRPIRGDADGGTPAATASVLPSASRELRAQVATHEGQLDLQAEIIHELLREECADTRIRALQAAQRGLTICREIVTDIEELGHEAVLARGVVSLERQFGGQGGGIVASDEAPPFNPPGGATH